MHTRQLLKVLMERSDLNPNALASLLKGSVKQPQIHKFVSGLTKEPKRSTLEPVAAFYGISVDAFFDETQAEALLAQIASGEFVVQRGRATRRTITRTLVPTPIGLDNAARSLAHHINEVDDAQQREVIGQRLLTLARAPDSTKALEGVLQAFAITSQPAAGYQPPVGGIAGNVLARHLGTETSDITAAKDKGRQTS